MQSVPGSGVGSYRRLRDLFPAACRVFPHVAESADPRAAAAADGHAGRIALLSGVAGGADPQRHRADLGARHYLPVYPLLFVLSFAGFARLGWLRRQRLLTAVLIGAALVLQAVGIRALFGVAEDAARAEATIRALEPAWWFRTSSSCRK